MNCDSCRESFDDFIDRELSSARQAEFLRHLEECARCKLEFNLFNRMIESMERMDEADPPPGFNDELVRQIAGTRTEWIDNPPGLFLGRSLAFWSWSVAFCGAFLLFLGTFVLDGGAQQANLPPVPMSAEDKPVLAFQDEMNREEVSRVLQNAKTEEEQARLFLVRHEGRVEILKLGASEWTPVEQRISMGFGDRIRTGEDGSAGLEFPGEVALRIKPASVLQVVSESELRLNAGETWVMVRRKGRAFSVETPNAVASVRGTKYSVETRGVGGVYHDALRQEGATVAQILIQSGDLVHGAPRAGLALARRFWKAPGLEDVLTKVQVYESSVWVASRLPSGEFGPQQVLPEGFGTEVAHGVVAKNTLLEERDFLAWRRVMVYDGSILEKARASLQLPSLTRPATVDVVEPTSTSGPGAIEGFEDIQKTH